MTRRKSREVERIIKERKKRKEKKISRQCRLEVHRKEH
jgi:hypothetical protein